MKINLSKKYEEMFKDREDIFYYILYGGRAGSKSFTSSIYLANRLVNGKGNLVYCRQYMTNVSTTIIPEFLEKISLLKIGHLLKVNKDNITCLTNGNQLWFKGLETSESTAEAGMKGIKSLSVVLIDESQEVKEKAFDNLLGTIRDKDLNLKLVLCLNPTDTTSWLYQRFFKGLDYNFSGILDNKLYVYSCYKDSVKFLSDTYLKEIENIKLNDPVKYENQYLGKWLNSNEKAILSKELLDLALTHVDTPQNYEQIVVALDPAVTTNVNSDNTGIAVCGKANGHFYLLHVEENKWTPQEWARKAKELYDNFRANFIVYESNQGGDMIESTLRTVLGSFVKIKAVRATQGKIIRFDPVHALYEQNLIHHLGRFFDLETQLLTYTGNPKQSSPNSLDAMVWGITSLNTSGKSNFTFV